MNIGLVGSGRWVAGNVRSPMPMLIAKRSTPTPVEPQATIEQSTGEYIRQSGRGILAGVPMLGWVGQCDRGLHRGQAVRAQTVRGSGWVGLGRSRDLVGELSQAALSREVRSQC